MTDGAQALDLHIQSISTQQPKRQSAERVRYLQGERSTWMLRLRFLSRQTLRVVGSHRGQHKNADWSADPCQKCAQLETSTTVCKFGHFLDADPTTRSAAIAASEPISRSGVGHGCSSAVEPGRTRRSAYDTRALPQLVTAAAGLEAGGTTGRGGMREASNDGGLAARRRCVFR